MKEYFDKWIDEHSGELLRDISRLVAVRSVRGEAKPGMPFGEGPAMALKEAMTVCRELGFLTKDYDGYVGAADANTLERGLDILCHLDVVHEGTGWDSDPYMAVINNGSIYGRGTDDDKGPAVCAMYAMKAVMECGVPMKKNVRLILGTDEESGSGDISYYYETKGEKPAPGTFSPDNAFPVYNVEKGLYRQSFKKSFAETDAQPRVKYFRSGLVHNIIPPEADAEVVGLMDAEILDCCAAAAEEMDVRLTVENGKLHVSGLSAHASTPHEGKNALTAMIRLLNLLPLADTESSKALKELAALYPHGDWSGKAVGVAMEDDVSEALTLAFSILEMNDSGLSGMFDSRTPICANEENCCKVVQDKMSSLGYELDGSFIPPHYTPEDTEFMQTLLRSYEMYTGEKGKCIPSGGTTYVHDIPGGVAFGVALPGVVTNLHGPNEHIPVSNLLTATKIFAQVIYDICCV